MNVSATHARGKRATVANTVNSVGVTGRSIVLYFKQAFPASAPTAASRSRGGELVGPDSDSPSSSRAELLFGAYDCRRAPHHCVHFARCEVELAAFRAAVVLACDPYASPAHLGVERIRATRNRAAALSAGREHARFVRGHELDSPRQVSLAFGSRDRVRAPLPPGSEPVASSTS